MINNYKNTNYIGLLKLFSLLLLYLMPTSHALINTFMLQSAAPPIRYNHLPAGPSNVVINV